AVVRAELVASPGSDVCLPVAVVVSGVTLDVGVLGDHAGDLGPAEDSDRERRAVEGEDLPGVLVAILDSVVVGVGVARIHVSAILGAVSESVVVLVPPPLLYRQRQVVCPLPPVRD